MSEPKAPKLSKLFWILLMVALMAIYIIMAARLIDAFFSNNIMLEMISYIIAGIIWIFPAKWIMFKINRTDKTGE